MIQCINKPPQGNNCVFDRRDGACYTRDTHESMKTSFGYDQKTKEEQVEFDQDFLLSQDPEDVTNRTLPTRYSGPLTTQSSPVTTQTGGVNSTTRATPTNNSITSSDVSGNTTPVAANQTEQSNVASVPTSASSYSGNNTQTSMSSNNRNNRNTRTAASNNRTNAANNRGNNNNASRNPLITNNNSMTDTGDDNGPSASNLDMVNDNYYYENNSSSDLINYRNYTGQEQNRESNDLDEIKYYIHNEGEDGELNTLFEYEFKDMGDLREMKSLKDIQNNVEKSMKDKIVLTDESGNKYLYDPDTQALTSFEETIEKKNRINKLENKVEFLEDALREKTDVDFTNANEVRNKLLYPVVEDNEVVFVSQDFGNATHPVVTTSVSENSTNAENEIEVPREEAEEIVEELNNNREEEELLEELNISKEELSEEAAEAPEELSEVAEASEELSEVAEAPEELSEVAEAPEELSEVSEAPEATEAPEELSELVEQESEGMSLVTKILVAILILIILGLIGFGLYTIFNKPAPPTSLINSEL